MLVTSHVPAPRIVPTHPTGSTDPRARVAAHRPDLSPASPVFQAAVVLLAAPALRFNVDLVSRGTGIARASVAVMARRLVDNGVWSADGADHPWSGPADPRFWNDVAVAQGRLCRRRGSDGQVEWAAPGSWHKPYEYVDEAGPGLAVAYRAPEPPPADAGPDLPAAARDGEDEPVPAPIRARTPAPLPPRPAAPPRVEVRPRPPTPAHVGAGAGWGDDLFPDARWLS